MKNNFENIPGEIFDWMSAIPFEALNAEQKRSVLQYFTREEYHELYESNVNIKHALHVNKRFDTHKADLMKLYDEKYQAQHSSFKLNTSILWKAASVFFLVSTLWFALKERKVYFPPDPVAIVKKDTVFIEREPVAVSRKIDTIYLQKTIERFVAKKQKRSLPENRETVISETRIPEKVYAVLPPAENDFQILPVGSINNISNAIKKNSMYDDSLEKNFKFVSM